MAKQYAFEYNGFALAKLNGNAYAAWTVDGVRKRAALGVPYSPIEGAKNALRAFVDSFQRTQTGNNPITGDVFERYLSKLEAERKNTMHPRSRIRRLTKFFGGVRVNSLTVEMCQGYAKASKAEGYSDWSIWGDLNIMRSALKWAGTQGKMCEFAVHQGLWNIKVPEGRTRVLTADEASALVESCRMPHVRLFTLLCLLTGQRHAAVCGLRWEQVNFETKEIDFRLKKHERDVMDKSSTKGRGVMQMGPTLLAALSAAKSMASTPYVIEYNGSHVANCRQGFNVARDRAGLGLDVTPHVLRHTAATWARNSADIETIAKMLGHADPRTTRGTYVHTTAGQSAGATEAVEGVLKFRPRKTG